MRGVLVLSFLQDMVSLSEASPDVYCDFQLSCRDGAIRVPRVLIQILCQDSYLLSAIAEVEQLEPCLLSMPEASVSDVRKVMRLFFSNHELEEVTFSEVPQSLCDALPWINWDKWLSSVRLRPVSAHAQLTLIKRGGPKEMGEDIAKKPREKPKPRQCSICGKKLYDRHSLKKHQDLVHFNIRNFACDQCPKRFGIASNLKDHVTNVHDKIKASLHNTCFTAVEQNLSFQQFHKNGK